MIQNIMFMFSAFATVSAVAANFNVAIFIAWAFFFRRDHVEVCLMVRNMCRKETRTS